VPKKILQHRLVNRGVKTVVQVLIKWSSLLESLAKLCNSSFLQLRLEDKPFPLEEGGGGGSTRMSLARQIKQPIQLITELMGRLALVVLGGQAPCEWALGGLMVCA
jgi:hypothetical protein